MFPIEPPSEIVQVTKLTAHQIEKLLDRYGVAIREMGQPARRYEEPILMDALLELLFKIFTDYDRYRTEEVEHLKRELTRLISVLPTPPMVIQELLRTE